MVIKTSHNDMFELIKNTKNAFALDIFEDKYLPEFFEGYDYIVGDISSGLLRLKGFKRNKDESFTLRDIKNYTSESCALKCPLFIVRKITEDEYHTLRVKPREVDTFVEENFVLEKENFDKDSLELISTPAVKPNIVIDAKKMNEIPKGYLPKDLAEIAKKEEQNKQKNHNNNKQNNRRNHSNNNNNNINNNSRNKNNKNNSNANTNGNNRNNSKKHSKDKG